MVQPLYREPVGEVAVVQLVRVGHHRAGDGAGWLCLPYLVSGLGAVCQVLSASALACYCWAYLW